MRKTKVRIQGNGIVTCLGQREVLKRIKNLDESTWVQEAYQGDGFVGFNVATGKMDLHPGPTIVKLYELPKNKDLSLYDLHSFFRRKWQRLQHELEGRVKSFYTLNWPLN